MAALAYQGCFSSIEGWSINTTYVFNSQGHCQTQCAQSQSTYQATSQGDQCLCGNTLPSTSTKVDDTKCDIACSGYASEKCGGKGFYSIYLTGAGTGSTYLNSSATTTAMGNGATPAPSNSSSGNPPNNSFVPVNPSSKLSVKAAMGMGIAVAAFAVVLL